ncbi:unnamed protein product [Urochloa humidicola]
MYAALPIRRPPPVDAAVLVDIGPPICVALRRVLLEKRPIHNNQIIVHVCNVSTRQRYGKLRASRHRRMELLHLCLQEEQAHTDQVMVIEADQQVVRVIGHVAQWQRSGMMKTNGYLIHRLLVLLSVCLFYHKSLVVSGWQPWVLR